jgi:hypothetical protein
MFGYYSDAPNTGVKAFDPLRFFGSDFRHFPRLLRRAFLKGIARSDHDMPPLDTAFDRGQRARSKSHVRQKYRTFVGHCQRPDQLSR